MRDCRKYAREFIRTDLDSDGLITAQEAKTLFERSGLGNDVLIRIWDLADVNRMNHLGFTEFIAAMHLIQLARAGQPPQASLPPALLDFLRGFQGSPQQLALEGSSRSASASRSRSATPRGTAARLVPSRRDCRKYAREFQRMDADRDGALTADEARTVFLRSGLSNQTLGQVFDLVDWNRSGRLGFVEFVAAMHLIRLGREGRPVPATAAELSPELTSFLGGLQDSPAELAREGSSRSASRAREAAPPPAAEAKPFGATESPFDMELPTVAPAAPPSFDQVPMQPSSGTAFEGFDSVPQPGTQVQPRLDFLGTGKKKEKHKSRRHDHARDEAAGYTSPAHFEHASPTASPATGSRSGTFAGPAPESSPSTRTRMGLPIPDLATTDDDYGVLSANPGARDPHYTARVREILGLPGGDCTSPNNAAAVSGEVAYHSQVDVKEHAFDPQRIHPGDYDSPVMWTVLMGAKPALGAQGSVARSRAAETAVRPPSGAPFLRTIAPNYRLGEPSHSGSYRLQQPVTSGGHAGLSSERAGRLPRTSVPSTQVLREQLSALPAAYTSQVPMSV